MRHRMEIQVRWGDMDSYAHVNNVAYAAYIQEARAAMFAAAVDSDAGLRVGTVVVARMRVEYLRPLLYRPAPVIAHTWVTGFTGATFTVACEIDDPEPHPAGPYCRGTTVLVPFDLPDGRPRRVRPAERSALERFFEPAPAPAPAAQS